MWPRFMPISNFYPRPPRGGRHRRDAKASGRKSISIHALREEGDAGALGTAYASNISIHALREEGDPGAAVHCGQDAEFLSTPSARRATASGGLQKALKNISIHALREEGDAMLFFSGSKHRKFLSTPSARRATHAAVRIDRLLRFLSTPSARRATQRPGGLC